MPVRTHALSDCLYQDVCRLFEGSNPATFRPPLDDIPSVAEPVKAIAASALLESLMKKFIPESSAGLDAVAMEKFLACNYKCGTWDRTYRDDLFLPFLVGHFREEVHRFWEGRFGRHPLVNSYSDIIDAGRFGPGVSRGSRSQDFYTKAFDSDLSATSPFLIRRWISHMNGNPLWRVAEFIRQCHGNAERVMRSSKISFVPKNDRTSRTIAVEPSLNTWYQLGLGEMISARLKSDFGIDLTSQAEVNRELARIGSITGKIATIDLESASDSISLLMVKHLFPKAFYDLLAELRTDSIETPQGVVSLNILSSMGNGFTFPLQTMIFSCAVRACQRYLGFGTLRAGEDWSVFGDDIIVRVEILQPLLSLLSYLGFTVNDTKSFFEGPFRESCGRDYFRGIDVRGVYIRSLNSQQDVYKAINLLNRWSQIHGIPLPAVFRYLRGLIKGKPFFVPRWEADYAGVKVPSSYARRLRDRSSWRYTRWEIRPSALTFHVGLASHPKYGDRPLNEEGRFVAYLGGFVEQDKIYVRHDGQSYRARTRRTLNWDYPSPTFVAEVGQLVWPEKPDDYQWQEAIGARNLSGY